MGRLLMKDIVFPSVINKKQTYFDPNKFITEELPAKKLYQLLWQLWPARQTAPSQN